MHRTTIHQVKMYLHQQQMPMMKDAFIKTNRLIQQLDGLV